MTPINLKIVFLYLRYRRHLRLIASGSPDAKQLATGETLRVRLTNAESGAAGIPNAVRQPDDQRSRLHLSRHNSRSLARGTVRWERDCLDETRCVLEALRKADFYCRR